jgi:hypothetical protein
MEHIVSIHETGIIASNSWTAVIGLHDVGLAGSIAAFYITWKLELHDAARLESDLEGKPFTLKSRDAVASNGLIHNEFLGLLRN